MSWLHPITTHNVNIDDINDIDDGNSPNNDIVCLAGWGLLPEGSVAACTNMLCVTWFKLGADDDDYHDDDDEEEEEDEDSEAKQLNKILISVRCKKTKDNDCTDYRAEKSDFWKSIYGDLRQGDLNRFYPPCKVNAGSDVLDG